MQSILWTTIWSALVFVMPTVATAPKQIIVSNQCSFNLLAAYQTNGDSQGKTIPVSAKSQTTISLPVNWEGRVWARKSCDVHDCRQAGAASPASLAELKFSGENGIDYYDVSFVDGFNLPIQVEPVSFADTDRVVATDPRHCQPSLCSSIPNCPADLQVRHPNNNEFVACQSACSRYQQDAYCCTGSHDTPSSCTTNHFAQAVKAACPDIYSYPYDDDSSVYGCNAKKYQVTFCPSTVA